MTKQETQTPLPVSIREAALGVFIAIFAAVALIGALSVLASVAGTADAQGGGGIGAGGDEVDDGGGGGNGGGGDGGRNHVFPVPAEHSYGDGFGAGRNHQGQDVFAKCGRKLVSARAGRVQTVATHSSAGNYIVIDGKGTGVDLAYMHLRDKALPREGSRVAKGEKIGVVGETGNASGCHLHFEKWSGPGYYEGGNAQSSVTKALKSWDRYS